MAEMLEQDIDLTAYALAEKYGVDIKVAYKKIVQATDWTREELVNRGKDARKVAKNNLAMNTKRRREMVRQGLVFCLFCEIANNREVCTHCENRLDYMASINQVPYEWGRIINLTAQQSALPAKYMKLFKWVIGKRIMK